MQQQLENMPMGIRIVCKMLEIISKKKFPKITRNEQYNIISMFLFDIYLLPLFQIPSYVK